MLHVKKSLSRALLITILFSGLVLVSNVHFGTVHASTNISGIITSDATWTMAGSPYIITGDTLIDANVFLNIEAGVVVEFDNGTNLIVDGKLIANGDKEHPITFTSNAETPAPNDWGTINLRSSSSAAILKWASISYANDGITVTAGSPTITNCSITDNQRYGIYVSAGAPTITDTTISNNGKDGIYNYVGDITITNSTISNNEGNGIYKDSGSITVRASVISNNRQSGIYGGAGGGTFAISDCKVSYNGHNGVTICYSEVTITNSEITNNNQDGVHMASGTLSGSATITGTTISNNNGNGVYKSSGSMQITNSTIKFNHVGIAATPFKLVGADSFQEKSGDTMIVYNNIVDNTLYAIENIGPGTNTHGEAINLIAKNNWWGTTNTSLIDQLIRDIMDDFSLGRVEYVPFLTAEAPAASSLPAPDSEPEPQPGQEPDPKPDTEPTPANATQISISVDTSSTVVGSAVNIYGILTDENGNPLQNKLVTLSYSVTDNDWVPIGSSITNAAGEYYIQWISTASGTFTLKAEWNGNDEYLGTSATTTLTSLPYQNQYVFYIESNSTITALTFDATESELIFTASGASGTTGYVKATIPKDLLYTEGNWSVLVDEKPTIPTIKEDANQTYLHFTYGHSTKTIKIKGPETTPEFPSWIPILLILTALAVAVAIYITKTPRNDVETNHNQLLRSD